MASSSPTSFGVFETIEEFATTIRETSGAIGVTRRHLTELLDLAVMPIEVVIHPSNSRPSLFYESLSRPGEVGGINTIILTTLVMIIFVLMIATPIGVVAGVTERP